MSDVQESKLPFDAATDAKKTLSDPVAFEAYMSLLDETAKELADFDRPYTARSIRQAVAMILLLRSAEQPEGRSYDRCAHIGSPYAAGTRANMPCRIPRKDHLEAGDETESGYLFDHDFVEPTQQAFDALSVVRRMKPVEHMPAQYRSGYQAALDDVRIALGEDVVNGR